MVCVHDVYTHDVKISSSRIGIIVSLSRVVCLKYRLSFHLSPCEQCHGLDCIFQTQLGHDVHSHQL